MAEDFKKRIDLGPWDEAGLGRMLSAAAILTPSGERIGYISARFLGIPYRENTLTGSADVPEELVVCLSAVDCFTYLDYVEAMRLSRSFKGFEEQLRNVRYRDGLVEYAARNHFFTDWAKGDRVRDVTAEVGRSRVRTVEKVLNRKDDGTPFLAGIPEKARKVTYLPLSALDRATLAALEAGDYIGVYTETEGLDVSHVGIAIRQEDGGVFFRHASLVEGKVIEQNLRYYLSGKPGIVVLRAIEEQGAVPT